MKKIMFLVLATASCLAFSESAQADWQWQKVACSTNSCGFTYQRQFVPEQVVQQPYVQPQIQVQQPVVNNYVQPAQPVVNNYVQPAQQIVTPAPVVKTEAQTTVVNNLVGIPVPVNYTQPIAAQGQTVYGYSSVTQAQGNLDMGLLYNQAARLTDQAQQLAGQAATDFASLVQSEGQNRSDVAKIIAQGQAARMALEMTQGDKSAVIQRSFEFRVMQGSDGNMSVQQIKNSGGGGHTRMMGGGHGQPQAVKQDFSLLTSDTSNNTNVSNLLKQRCVSCHGNQRAQGGLNLEVAINDSQQRSVLDRIVTDDAALRMPRNADGSAGSKLNIDEMKLLFNAMSTGK